MDSFKTISLSFGVVASCYVMLSVIVLAILQPMRMAMLRIGEELLSEERWNSSDREQINEALDTAWSFRAGCLLPLAITRKILSDLLSEEDRKKYGLQADPRYHLFYRKYLISLFGANLIAAPISFILLSLGVLLRTWMIVYRKFRMNDEPEKISLSVQNFLEDPLIRVAEVVDAAYQKAPHKEQEAA